MSIGYYNGSFKPLDAISVPLTDRALYFGDGIYEALPARNGIPYLLSKHLERFFKNAGTLGIDPGMDKNELGALLREALRLSGERNALLYFQASRYSLQRVHAPAEQKKCNLLITVTKKELPPPNYRMRLTTYPDLRYGYCNIKTLNLLPSVISSEYALRNGCDESVFVKNGRVTECSHSNISIISGGVLYTHPDCELILPGITKSQLLIECKRLGIPKREEAFGLDELYNADCVLISSSTKPLLLAREIDGLKCKKTGWDIGDELIRRLREDFYKKTEK